MATTSRSTTSRSPEFMPACGCCGHERGFPVEGHADVRTCERCGGLNGRCYLGQSYTLVLPQWDAPDACDPADQQYFDLECLGSGGITRRHGWFNPATRKITQVG